jgi:signal transduction histidine kinase
MPREALQVVRTSLRRRAEFVIIAARAVSVAVAFIALAFFWNSPTTRSGPALALGLGYAAFFLAHGIWIKRQPRWRRLANVVHDVVDALAVGLGAALSGGLSSPIWLLLYPHVVGVAVRGGLRYALTLGTLDALIVYALALMSPSHPLGELNAPAVLFCAFLGGSTSSYLHRIQAQLADANRELQAKNEQLLATVGQVQIANQRLEDLHRLRDEYLRNVSHEFRSPLTVIRGYAEFVHDQGVPSDASLRDVMSVMLDSSDHMIDMVDTLLEVSRIEQGETGRRLEMRPVVVREVLEAALQNLRGLAGKKGTTLAIDLPDEGLDVSGDPPLLVHAMRHLVGNALKYGPAGATVHIRGRAENGLARLEIEDHGIGIAPEHLPHIFEKFYVADGGLTRRTGGAGVGLYLAREIVRLHHGSIEVTSRPGEGSIFSVTLPRPPLPVVSGSEA